MSNKPLWNLLEITDNNPEYDLFESVISEFTWISGWPIYYYKKLNLENADYLYGEDTVSEYTEAYKTKLIYEPTEEIDVLNSFGIQSDDVIQYMQIPKIIFKSDISEKYKIDYNLNENIVPMVGDCIRTLWNNKIYQIVDVGSEQKIFQGRKMIWEFITRPYVHSEESESANNVLWETPEESEFPIENFTTETQQLSAYGDNEKIDNESDFDEDPDTGVYGF